MTAWMVPWVFLTVSVVSLVVQSGTMVRILRGPRLAGLARTSVCRVGVGVGYVSLGIIALCTDLATTGVLALGVFSVTQLVWIVNGLSDARLKKRLIESSSSASP